MRYYICWRQCQIVIILIFIYSRTLYASLGDRLADFKDCVTVGRILSFIIPYDYAMTSKVADEILCRYARRILAKLESIAFVRFAALDVQ